MNAVAEFCASCGSSVSPGARFCRGCGTSVVAGAATREGESALPDVPTAKSSSPVAVSDAGSQGFVPQAPLSLLDRASSGDREALSTMFRQFLAEGEQVLAVEYLGLRGLWIFGVRSFACLTERRFATIQAKRFGHIDYQDAEVDSINSGSVVLPSKLVLYLFVAMTTLFTAGGALLFLPFTVRLFYRFQKCGLILRVRGHGSGGGTTPGGFTLIPGLQIYVFTDRKLIGKAMSMYRVLSAARSGQAGGYAGSGAGR